MQGLGKSGGFLNDSELNAGSRFETSTSALFGGGLMVAGGIASAINGLQHGGIRGDIQGAGGIASAVGGIAQMLPGLSSALSFLGPIGAIAGPLLSIASMMFGDPKALRQKRINRILADYQFYTPISLDVTAGMNGGAIRYNAQGQIQSTDQSPYPVVQNPYLDYRPKTGFLGLGPTLSPVYVPGRILQNFGGSGPGMGPSITGQTTTAAIPGADLPSNAAMHAMIVDNHQAVAEALQKAMHMGGSGTDVLHDLRQRLG